MVGGIWRKNPRFSSCSSTHGLRLADDENEEAVYHCKNCTLESVTVAVAHISHYILSLLEQKPYPDKSCREILAAIVQCCTRHGSLLSSATFTSKTMEIWFTIYTCDESIIHIILKSR